MVCKAANIWPGKTSSVIAVNRPNPRQCRVGSSCQTCECLQTGFACKIQHRLGMCSRENLHQADYLAKWGHSLGPGVPCALLLAFCCSLFIVLQLMHLYTKHGAGQGLLAGWVWVSPVALQGHGCAHCGLSVQAVPTGAS